jgi:CheY-like chemotaxis protein
MIGEGVRLKDSGFVSYLTEDMSSSSLGRNDDDVIDFLEEDNEDQHTKTALVPWKILIADDDSNVHETTLLALSGVLIHGRPLEFLHAYSAKEAQTLIEAHPDMALVLLDVVMETVDAGLKLVSVIRNDLARRDLRIVLRTGQPGYAPEKKVNHEFAIDGYTTKSKLTRSILISVLSDTLMGAKSSDGLAN